MAGLVAAYLLVVVVVSLTTPRKVIAIGDSYCYDSWCIAIEKVSATARL
jgi:hypothetical protein